MSCNVTVLNFSTQFQFYDLKELFRTSGEVPDTHYIFMVSCIYFVSCLTHKVRYRAVLSKLILLMKLWLPVVGNKFFCLN